MGLTGCMKVVHLSGPLLCVFLTLLRWELELKTV